MYRTSDLILITYQSTFQIASSTIGLNNCKRKVQYNLDSVTTCDKDHFSICDFVTVFVETKSVTKSRLHCICLTYNFRFPRYNFVSLAGNNASPSCMLKLWWTSCHKWWHHHHVDEPFCFAPSHRVESCNMETKIIQLNHFSMGHPVSYENLRKKYLMKKKGCG